MGELRQGSRYEGRLSLKELLGIAKISKSSYEYSKNALETEESLDNQRIRMEIKFVWLRSKKRYGYRKITRDVFLRFGNKVNHKKVLRMMNEMGIYANLSGHDKGYSSYKGKVGKTAPNLLKRDFNVEHSLEKAGTDVTEFKFDWSKVYLSPIIDFYNDEILGYALLLSPNMKMKNDMYSKHPLIYNMMLHSDQGWQYQMESYQENLKSHGIIQSMSRKGNCLDNSKTENFFSKLKKELFYGHEKEFHNFAEFQKAIDEYIEWYNNERIAHTSMLCYSSI
ncbi:MAG: IS3 family transposase [Candidatus Onthovivens sp.]|nr:IS3 family transposase [Candidatus Onthovivens sp.]